MTVALVVLVAWPAGTPPITAADGSVVEGSVAELATSVVGETEQTILLRAPDRTIQYCCISPADPASPTWLSRDP